MAVMWCLQAMMMLHLWIAKAGHVRVSEVEHALKRIGRDDIIERYIHGNLADDSATQLANGNTELSIISLVNISRTKCPSIHSHFDVAVEQQMLITSFSHMLQWSWL